MKHLVGLIFCAGFVSNIWARDLNKEYKKTKIKVAHESIEVYLADNPLRRELGLMHITALKKNEGMVFIFDNEQFLSFWMKNTLIPLSIGYFDKSGTLIDIQEMAVANSIMDQNPPGYTSKKPAMFALEMNKNWFSLHKIKVGARLSPLSALQTSLPK